MDNSIIVVDENGPANQQLQDRLNSPIIKMSVAPNGRFLALYRQDQILTVMSMTFTTKVCNYLYECLIACFRSPNFY